MQCCSMIELIVSEGIDVKNTSASREIITYHY